MTRNIAPFSGLFILLLLLGGLAGCEPAALVSWAPDGSRAAYFVPATGKTLPGVSYLIDPAGKVVGELGQTFGSFAWTADSKTVYFGGTDDKGGANGSAIHNWLSDTDDATTAPTTDEYPSMVLNRWQDGNVERLAPLGNRYVLFVEASPEGNWISVVAYGKDSGKIDGRAELFVYNTGSKKLYQLSDRCSTAACFTASNKLAYVEATRERQTLSPEGKIVEVTLDESAEHLERTPLVDVLWEKTSFLQRTDDGLLFTSVPLAIPARSSKEKADRPAALYHFTRANGGVAAMEEFTGPLFQTSPDGKRILYLKLTPETKDAPEKRELAVMNSNGSDAHVLVDITGYGPQPPIWPGWHGNDQIMFASKAAQDLPVAEGQEARVAFDVVDYKIDARGAMEPGMVLSRDWPMEMKPWIKKAEYHPTTAPATPGM